MADETSICNAALAKLGCPLITSLSDGSKHAQFCSRFYASTRDEVLAAHRWNFAMKRATLTKSTAPAFEWKYSYTLPSDCLRVVQLNGYETTETRGEFSVEAGLLLADADTAQIRYVAQITTASLFPTLFIEALATKLAANLAGPLTGSQTMAGEFTKQYEAITGPRARMCDAFESVPKRKPAWSQSDLVASRFA